VESKTEEECSYAYGQAKQPLCFKPDNVESLDGIYESPKYYSGCILFHNPGSLNMRGDAAAEQNHSSAAA
jgi:hypothetical protein